MPRPRPSEPRKSVKIPKAPKTAQTAKASAAAASPFDRIRAKVDARVEDLLRAGTKPRHDADHWEVAGDTIIGLLGKSPGVVPGDDASPAGVQVGGALVEAVRPFTHADSRLIYTETERRTIVAGERLVAGIRRELDDAARTKDEREAANAYGVGAPSASSSPEACSKALHKILAAHKLFPALWTLAQLDDSDHADVTAAARKVNAIAQAKKPRVVERKGKKLSVDAAVLALEVWCGRVVASARKRLPDGHPLKGELIESVRPESTRRKSDKPVKPPAKKKDETDTNDGPTA